MQSNKKQKQEKQKVLTIGYGDKGKRSTVKIKTKEVLSKRYFKKMYKVKKLDTEDTKVHRIIVIELVRLKYGIHGGEMLMCIKTIPARSREGH